MSSNVDGRTIADYDWCWRFLSECTGSCESRKADYECDCIDEYLHAPSAETSSEFDDWDGDIVEGETACGTSARLTIPGVGSRMGCPRCVACCDRLGYPHGDGSPKNDEACRAILWPTSEVR
jgi:hypothetical protein